MAVLSTIYDHPQIPISSHDHRHLMPDYDMSAYPYQRPVFGRHPYGIGHADHRFYRRGVPNVAFSGTPSINDQERPQWVAVQYTGLAIVCAIALIICLISLKVWWSKRTTAKEAAKARRQAVELGDVEVREVGAKETAVTKPEAGARSVGDRHMTLLTWA